MLYNKLLISLAFFGIACFYDLRDFKYVLYSISIMTTNIAVKRAAPQLTFFEYLTVTVLQKIIKGMLIHLFIFDKFILADPASFKFLIQVVIQTILLGNPKLVVWLESLASQHVALDYFLKTVDKLAATVLLSHCYDHFFEVGHSPLYMGSAVFLMSVVDPLIMMFGMLEYKTISEAFHKIRKDIFSNILLYGIALEASWLGFFHLGFKGVHIITVGIFLGVYPLISSAPSPDHKVKQE